VLNVAKLKHFYENIEKSVDTEGDPAQFNQNFNQDNDQVQKDFSDIFNKARNEGPITRAKAKLIKYKDAAQLALILLKKKQTTSILCVIQVTIAINVKVKTITLQTNTCFNFCGFN
jgi:hypothetical protein